MTNIANIKRTKKYKALVAAGLDADKAIRVLSDAVVDPRVESLKAAGLTEDQITSALSEVVVPASLSPKDVAEALVAERNLAFTKGRVYANAAIAEAVVRVLKTGTPEIVNSSGEGRTVAVVLFPQESGDVALQNLSQPL